MLEHLTTDQGGRGKLYCTLVKMRFELSEVMGSSSLAEDESLVRIKP